MSGWSTFNRWKRINELAESMGFRLGNPKHGAWSNSDGADSVSLYPGEKNLPVFSRDAELFTGTFRDIEIWLAGWERAQAYDMMLRISNPDKRKKHEAKEVERQRIVAEKLEQKTMWKTLKEK